MISGDVSFPLILAMFLLRWSGVILSTIWTFLYSFPCDAALGSGRNAGRIAVRHISCGRRPKRNQFTTKKGMAEVTSAFKQPLSGTR